MKWYDVILWQPYIDYFESNPDFDIDSNDNDSIFSHFSDTVRGLIFAYVTREHPTSKMPLGAYGEAGYLSYMQADDCDKDLEKIWQSIPCDEGKSRYELDPELLSPPQLALLIIYPFASRTDEKIEVAFAKRGDLKRYILKLKGKVKK